MIERVMRRIEKDRIKVTSWSAGSDYSSSSTQLHDDLR